MEALCLRGLVFELQRSELMIFDEMLSCFRPFLTRELVSLGDQNRMELVGLMLVVSSNLIRFEVDGCSGNCYDILPIGNYNF